MSHLPGVLFFWKDPERPIDMILLQSDQSESFVETSGIAALLLDGGHTEHSLFKIPLKLDVNSMSSMISKDMFHDVSQTMQDIMKSMNPLLEHVPFGEISLSLEEISVRFYLLSLKPLELK
ncbi:hypothetical protein PHYBLDRAFT_152915 [Phycomyces blakesleeanus NRRL 1555(-)]|uniref:ATP-dependent DNA helicase n=1 Tax=Phycomyces blakesleeanus (strain ATCC 8743b / DSM 1359 / FGSC 10004 / NBRC 33097 / NRRL 1555) TaxID=763407 RepID=A0A162ZCU1_PHYB8|nr:hypothetical protein PHYBLDRAFT_152915 [Phycomyces blakesleeanus NRRL 1555(-)]OAD65891.1 hypothetical protein PHYBLDRAFT_152915 [Phycomyces blakesleeanus NRRL 1555(-)]|eukprot:XP_018283931.1 hypothetical protein PHYBLDRAFT_152915 [Phycomyces blakesleeanus NRRL 1555(-)]